MRVKARGNTELIVAEGKRVRWNDRQFSNSLRLGLALAAAVAVLGLLEVTQAHAIAPWVVDDSRYRFACGRLLALIEGPFGALVTTAAGIGAVISSALGGFKIAWVLIVTAVGAFILRSYTTLFFGGSCLGSLQP